MPDFQTRYSKSWNMVTRLDPSNKKAMKYNGLNRIRLEKVWGDIPARDCTWIPCLNRLAWKSLLTFSFHVAASHFLHRLSTSFLASHNPQDVSRDTHTEVGQAQNCHPRLKIPHHTLNHIGVKIPNGLLSASTKSLSNQQFPILELDTQHRLRWNHTSSYLCNGGVKSLAIIPRRSSCIMLDNRNYPTCRSQSPIWYKWSRSSGYIIVWSTFEWRLKDKALEVLIVRCAVVLKLPNTNNLPSKLQTHSQWLSIDSSPLLNM